MNSNKLFSLLILELTIVFSALLILFYIGQVVASAWQFFSLGLAVYFLWHIYHIVQLLKWLNSKQCSYLFASYGIWKEICTQLTHLQQNSQSSQSKLVKYIDNYRTFVDKLPDAVFVINMDRLEQGVEIEWFNKTAQRLFKLKKKKHIGVALKEIFPDPAVEDFLSIAKNKSRLELFSPIDQNKVFSLQVIPYHKSSSLLLFRDVSRVYWTDKMRKDFIANVSHELRTPLTVISGYLETFECHFENDKTYLIPVQTMQQQSLRMTNLVNDLLILSKLEAATGKDKNKPLLPVPAMIENVIKDAKVLNSGKIFRIESDIDYTLMMHGYENEIQSMMANLINNAIRYTPAKSLIQVCWYSHHKKIIFSVKDNGEGIEEKHLQRLTERFYRVDKGRSRNSGGTGLGLSIVKHVIKHHNGKLKIKSKVGKGSQFICTFNA